jgi:BASS family bile acid:Na+ symporter
MDLQMTGLNRTLCLGGMYVLGFLFPQLGSLAFLIKYLVMYMLFMSFLTMPLSGNPARLTHLWILVANVLLGFIPYLILRPISEEYALIAFITGITPTGIAAPVLISLIRRDVSFVATSTLITNICIAFIIPATLPFIVGSSLEIHLMEIVFEVMMVVIAPFIVSFGIRLFVPRLEIILKKGTVVSLFVWLITIWIAIAKSAMYLKNQDDAPASQIFTIAGISLILCILAFVLGHFIGGKTLNKEAAQSLGQKNIMLTIWISLTYLNPVVALGPTFYLMFHHIYNGWLLWRFSEKNA